MPNIGPTELIILLIAFLIIVAFFRFIARASSSGTDSAKSTPARKVSSMPNEEMSVSPKPQNNVPMSAIAPVSNSPAVSVHLLPDARLVKAATETVNVPTGVTITVRRARQVEHTVSIGWTGSVSGNAELGLKGIVSASILGKIEKTQGRSYQQTEKVEYEIQLNGEKNNQYTLTWVDTLLTGTAEIRQGNVSNSVPFEFRAGTELEVIPSGKPRNAI